MTWPLKLEKWSGSENPIRLSQAAVPAEERGKIRPFNIISHLSRNHLVTVASLARSEEEQIQGRGLESHCNKVLVARIGRAQAVAGMLRRLPTATPSSMGYFYSPELQKAIDDELSSDKYDLIFVHCSSVAQYVAHVAGIPKVLDFGDMDSQKWLMYRQYRRFPLSVGYALEGMKLQREEARLAVKFDLCTCTTRQELRTLDSYRTGVRTGWFPNGVDFEYFKPAAEGYDADLISFIGRMDYYPNQQAMMLFCEKIFPRIRAARPRSKLVIVGSSPPKAIQRLEQIAGVNVTGSVPDVRPFVTSSSVSVAPLQIARGTQNKILEAMAMGVPVVTTPLAAEGVDVVSGEHLLTGQTEEEFAKLTLRLLNDRDYRKKLADSGRRRVLERHDWAMSMRRLDGILHDTVLASS